MTQDEDIDGLTVDQLRVEVRKLRESIRRHRGSTGREATGSGATLLTLTPLFPAGPDLADALRFYRDELGFSVEWEDAGMAGVRRGHVELNLVVNTNRDYAENTSASIGVRDLDALYTEYKAVTARVGPLEMKSWGRREFHMIVPSGVCLQFYELDLDAA